MMWNTSDIVCSMLFGTFLGILLFSVIIGIADDRADVVDVHLMGEMMCEEKGLEYDHREWNTKEKYTTIPIIYCKEKEVIDGTVLLKVED